MKKIILIVSLLVGSLLHAQNPAVTSTFGICNSNLPDETPQNSYFKDILNTLNPFVGTWVYINGNQKLTFSIKKVTKKYFPDKKIYKDFLVGNYSYSIDEGNTFIVNTIPQFLNSDPDANPIYTPCVDGNVADFSFIDVVLDKHFCKAIFEFVAGSTTQLKLTLKNKEGLYALVEAGETPPVFNPHFTIPNNVVLTKQ